MVTIQRLYERLEELVAAADTAVEEFSASGDLTQLQQDLLSIGATGYSLADVAGTVATAIDGSGASPSPSY